MHENKNEMLNSEITKLNDQISAQAQEYETKLKMSNQYLNKLNEKASYLLSVNDDLRLQNETKSQREPKQDDLLKRIQEL